jgi:lysozyme
VHRIIRGFLLVVLLCGLAACGGGKNPNHARGLPSGFGDVDPADWGRKSPARHDIHGVDVSKFQGEIDWSRAANSGVAFAFVKATEGGDRVDDRFDDNWRAARRSGVPRGAYHFYYFCRPAEEQAAWFIRHVPREAGALPPVLDMEWNHTSPSCKLRPPPEKVRSEAKKFLGILSRHYGQRPLIYTSIDFWEDNEMWRIKGYEFWLRSVSAHPDELYDGHPWTFWQYTGTGQAPGIDGKADLNAFAGSPAEWRAWLGRRSQ